MSSYDENRNELSLCYLCDLSMFCVQSRRPSRAACIRISCIVLGASFSRRGFQLRKKKYIKNYESRVMKGEGWREEDGEGGGGRVGGRAGGREGGLRV